MFGCDPEAETQSVDADVVACIRRLRPSYVVLAGCNNAIEPNLTCSRLLANATGVTVIAASGCVSTQGAHYAAISGEGQWWRIEPAATTGTTSSGAGGGTGGYESTGGAPTGTTSSGRRVATRTQAERRPARRARALVAARVEMEVPAGCPKTTPRGPAASWVSFQHPGKRHVGPAIRRPPQPRCLRRRLAVGGRRRRLIPGGPR